MNAGIDVTGSCVSGQGSLLGSRICEWDKEEGVEYKDTVRIQKSDTSRQSYAEKELVGGETEAKSFHARWWRKSSVLGVASHPRLPLLQYFKEGAYQSRENEGIL